MYKYYRKEMHMEGRERRERGSGEGRSEKRSGKLCIKCLVKIEMRVTI